MSKYLGINIDYERDKLIPEQGLVMLTKKGFYKREWENSPQEGFARAATCYCFGDYDLAQRVYDYVSKGWFTFASPVLSNAIDVVWPKDLPFDIASDWLEENKSEEVDGMPISCFEAGTPIRSKHGETNIEDLVAGDEVFTHKGRLRKVLATKESVSEYMYKLVCSYNGLPMYVTGDHWMLTDTGWTRVDNLDISKDLLAASVNEKLDYYPIVSVDRLEGRVSTVYDIQVAEDESFSVAGVIAHNCFLNYISDSKESLVDNSTETRWLSMNGGGVGTYYGQRSPDEKSTGVMAHAKTYDADTVAFRQTSCYLKDTEVLTSEGWKRFDEVNKNEKVAVSDEYGQISFEEPSEWIESEYSGNIHRFHNKNRGLDISVTANHNMVVERRNTQGWTGNLQLVRADELKHHNEIRLRTAALDSSKEDRIDAYTAFRIAHQADGYNANPTKCSTGIEFHFSKKRKVDRLISILKEVGLDYSINDSGESTKIYVKHKHLPKDLSFIDISSITPGFAAGILRELSYWDGHTSKYLISVSTVDKHIVDSISAIAVIAGWKCRVSITKPKNPKWKDIYTLSLSTKSKINMECVNLEVYPYEGKVYCCTVSTGMIVVRAGNVSLICGNSRRGSMAGYLDINHPEILKFIDMRNPTAGGDSNTRCLNLNHGVNITDEFMHAMIKDEKYELIDPKHGNTGNFLSAKEVWEKLIDTRFETGEPYLNFIDTVNRNIPKWIMNPLYKVVQSNLCTW